MNYVLQRLRRLADEGAIDRFAVQFAEFLARKDPGADAGLIVRGAELAHALSRQHTCVDLAVAPAPPFPGSASAPADTSSLIGDGTAPSLLTKDRGLLYLTRYHRYEQAVAADLLQRCRMQVNVDETRLADALVELFAGTQAPDWQRIAAVTAATRGLAVVTGGPGTGKTTTVLKLLAAIEMAAGHARTVALAAPTGKAAARLTAAMRGAVSADAPGLSDTARDAFAALPTAATTLHRLLGARPFEAGFRYHRGNPLPVDILVIDEVSMVDLALFAQTLAALPAHAQLVLLGDPDQLPSVEAGNVLRDIVHAGSGEAAAAFSAETATRIERITGDTIRPAESGNRLQDSLVRLDHNFRFSADDSVGIAATAALRGDVDTVTKVLAGSTTGSALHEVDANTAPALEGHYAAYSRTLASGADVGSLLSAFESARVLGVMHEGPLGVAALNDSIEAALASAGALRPDTTHYHGRPVLITRNDYNLRLYNGDVGLCYLEDGQPLAAFRQPDGTLLRYLATRLPPHETCFAMTVHKSQGSEFDEVALVLPRPNESAGRELQTRELVYTAITRARERFALYAPDGALGAALASRTVRMSGLPGRLSHDPPASPPSEPGQQLELF